MDWLGYIAAVCTTFSFIPQVVHIWRTRDTGAISLGMYSIFTFGIVLWLIYGIWLGNVPMIIANAITLILALCILSFKLYQLHHQAGHNKRYWRNRWRSKKGQ